MTTVIGGVGTNELAAHCANTGEAGEPSSLTNVVACAATGRHRTATAAIRGIKPERGEVLGRFLDPALLAQARIRLVNGATERPRVDSNHRPAD
jgi:hypothetical protein